MIMHHEKRYILAAVDTYLSTCATVFGPYHSPTDLPSPTPIWATYKPQDRKIQHSDHIKYPLQVFKQLKQ